MVYPSGMTLIEVYSLPSIGSLNFCIVNNQKELDAIRQIFTNGGFHYDSLTSEKQLVDKAIEIEKQYHSTCFKVLKRVYPKLIGNMDSWISTFQHVDLYEVEHEDEDNSIELLDTILGSLVHKSFKTRESFELFEFHLEQVRYDSNN